MTEMSKPAEILYRVLFDDLKFAKQQQWTITNYALVLMGAIFALANLGTGSPPIPEKIVLSLMVFPVVAVVVGLLLLHLQLRLYNTRERLEKLEKTFSQEDQSIVTYEPGPVTNTNIIGWMKIIGRTIEMIEKIDKELRCSLKPFDFFFVVLCGVVTLAGLVAFWAIWKL
jgi:hypothetical protein